LRHQLALERLLEDRLPQTFRASEIGGDDGFHFLHHRQPPLDLGHDAALFSERR
jgi:hypothetical protein